MSKESSSEKPKRCLGMPGLHNVQLASVKGSVFWRTLGNIGVKGENRGRADLEVHGKHLFPVNICAS